MAAPACPATTALRRSFASAPTGRKMIAQGRASLRAPPWERRTPSPSPFPMVHLPPAPRAKYDSTGPPCHNRSAPVLCVSPNGAKDDSPGQSESSSAALGKTHCPATTALRRSFVSAPTGRKMIAQGKASLRAPPWGKTHSIHKPCRGDRRGPHHQPERSPLPMVHLPPAQRAKSGITGLPRHNRSAPVLCASPHGAKDDSPGQSESASAALGKDAFHPQAL
jgi:hypothetical protein